VRDKIGYPAWILDDGKLADYYAAIDITTNFFASAMSVTSAKTQQSLDELWRPVDPTRWFMSPQTVNAYYNPSRNEIVFPAGILQAPFYESGQPQSVNYGGIGVIIGHELTHGFDDQGSKYDKSGRLAGWWDQTTAEQFTAKADCLREQYGAFTVDGAHVNGRNTMGENIADNGGIKQAFAAYTKWVKKHGREPLLPGLGLSHEQLFFLGFSQAWCGHSTSQDAERGLRTDPHSPSRFRVIGTLANTPAFAQSFNCPSGSAMVAKQQCNVW